MRQVILVAGPNGAGKTSFAREFLPIQRRTFVYINADEIEREMVSSPSSASLKEFQAGRAMLNLLDDAIAREDDVMLETTLATRIYVRRIKYWRSIGYSVGLIYLRLQSAEQAIGRVARRVAAGGHNIPEAVIRRRFSVSAKNLELLYKSLVDEWYVWDSHEGRFDPAEAWDQP